MILVFPWSRPTTDGRRSPKDYPWWDEVAIRIRATGHAVVQVSCAGEPTVRGCDNRVDGASLKDVAQMMRDCETWISVDNFANHLGWLIGKRGVVVFGPSDPEIFGHPENVNLLKGREFLRKRQFGLWSEEQHDPSRFVAPSVVTDAVFAVVREGRVK